MFTFFTDRDGKYQLASLAESGFDPLSRPCRFMLTEEAHHMFVGETVVQRILQRNCELMQKNKTDDEQAYGAIDQIGRASFRQRVLQSVKISAVPVSSNQQNK